jgi:hypothetical protein
MALYHLELQSHKQPASSANPSCPTWCPRASAMGLMHGVTASVGHEPREALAMPLTPLSLTRMSPKPAAQHDMLLQLHSEHFLVEAKSSAPPAPRFARRATSICPTHLHTGRQRPRICNATQVQSTQAASLQGHSVEVRSSVACHRPCRCIAVAIGELPCCLLFASSA